ELVQLKQGQVDFEGNARLHRVLTNLLTATGMAVDDHGRHLPLSDALLLLCPDDPRHEAVFRAVEPFLDRETLSEFRRLREYGRVEDRLRETESTINRLRAVLSPVARAIFGVMAGQASVDPRRIILDHGMMLWHLRPSEYFGQDTKATFGKLAIHLELS